MSNLYLISAIAVMACVMFFLRAFPFLISANEKKPSKLTIYLGHVMSPAAVAMLVIYCIFGHLGDLQDLNLNTVLPVFSGVVFVVLIHLWLKNMLISVFGGTIFYMLLIQFVFKHVAG